jgi:hypothetical protein
MCVHFNCWWVRVNWARLTKKGREGGSLERKEGTSLSIPLSIVSVIITAIVSGFLATISWVCSLSNLASLCPKGMIVNNNAETMLYHALTAPDRVCVMCDMSGGGAGLLRFNWLQISCVCVFCGWVGGVHNYSLFLKRKSCFRQITRGANKTNLMCCKSLRFEPTPTNIALW